MIFNPVARGEKAARFRQHLNAFGSTCMLKMTAGPNDARRLATEAVAEGFEIVVAAGGDGTLNEVLNGIADAPDGLERARLGVLPLGTVNVFARELGIPLKLNLAWRTICEAKVTTIDLPAVEYQAKDGQKKLCFAQLAGAGLDARAIELVSWSLKKKIGPLAYIMAGLKALAGAQSKITVTGGPEPVTGELVLIGNGRLYGGYYKVFPDADLRDGLIDVCVLPRVNWWVLARCGPGLLLRGRLPASMAHTFQAQSITLTGASRTPVEADGELLGHLPAIFSVQRKKLGVIIS